MPIPVRLGRLATAAANSSTPGQNAYFERWTGRNTPEAAGVGGKPMTTPTNHVDGRTAALFALAVAIMVALVVAWRIDAVATTLPPEQTFNLRVVDEAGAAVPGSRLEYGDVVVHTDSSGSANLTLHAPELIVVHSDGMISDAVVVGGSGEPDTTLRLLADQGPGGERVVMHFAGDYMMGRRYQEPTSEDTPLVTDEGTARAVVADIAPFFSLADLVSVNYESVIGTLSPSDAYSGKRFLLQSPPETLAALDELGVDVATLGNNHINDWLESGVASTIRNLDTAGIAHPGGGVTAAEAMRPAMLDAGGLRVGIVSMTTVTGDYVNDHLPSATSPVPAAIAEADMWQYEARPFGFGQPGDPNFVAEANRRPGAIWVLFDQLEDDISAGDAADLWQEMIRTYPELQDWVARRGHGGAARYSSEGVAASIAAARESGADLVVVQLHGGLQFADIGSEYFGRATREAVDAGADLVIGHHPHVVQGFEIYKDTLIAYSLGNFVFDQDFLSTHPSVILRTVFEGTELLEASVYPVMIDNYRPVAVGGEVADQILLQVNRASLQNAVAIRLPDLRIGSTRTDAPVTAAITSDHGRGLVVPTPGALTQQVSVIAAEPTALPQAQLVQIGAGTNGLTIGRDIFGYGTLEDVQADGSPVGGLEWSLPPDSLEINDDSPAGPWTVRLDRTSQHLADIIARTGARVSMPSHRWFDENGRGIGGPATYSVRVWAKRVGAGIPFVRVSFYEFDDTDPTREPQSTPLETVDLQLPLVNDGEWHELWVDLPDLPANANSALVGIGLAPPDSQSGTVWVDGLDVVEWRDADLIPEGAWVTTDYIAGPVARATTLTVASR